MLLELSTRLSMLSKSITKNVKIGCSSEVATLLRGEMGLSIAMNQNYL